MDVINKIGEKIENSGKVEISCQTKEDKKMSVNVWFFPRAFFNSCG